MSGPFELAPGSIVRVEPPTIPGVAVLPVSGPQGPPGPAGPPGQDNDDLEPRVAAVEASDTAQGARIAALEQTTGVAPTSWTHTQSSPVAVVQIVHGLLFRPAGVRCVDQLDQITEPDRITHPLLGVTEVTFGAPFTGVVDLS